MAAQIIPFEFESRPIRISIIDSAPWFVASDVCKAIGIKNSRDALSKLDDDEKGVALTDTLGGQQELATINESGLYTLILRSRNATKPGSPQHRFRKWVTAEVLPTIRKHGHFHDAQGTLDTLIGQTIGTNGFHILGALIKGKVANLPMAAQRRASSKLWAQTHAAFGVRSAADIPADQLDAARNFVAAYSIEGEWQPNPANDDVLDKADQVNLNALCMHILRLHDIYQEYRLYEVFSAVKSPAGPSLYGHLKDGACIARRYQPKLQASA